MSAPAVRVLRVTPRPTVEAVDPRLAATRDVSFRVGADGTLRSDARFAVRYADDGRIYRRALVLEAAAGQGPLTVGDASFPPFRGCPPELLGWASRPDLDPHPVVGIPSDADPANDDPDYLQDGLREDPVVAGERAHIEDEERLREAVADLPRWGTRCRRCGATDSAVRHSADGTVFGVRAVGQGELRSDGPAAGVPPLATAVDAYACIACDAVVQGSIADDLVETTVVADGEGDGIRRIAGGLRADDAWTVADFAQEMVESGVAFSGRLLRQGREVAWFEHRGNGGAMTLGILARARENGDGDHLYREIHRLTGPAAFEPEEPFILAVLERQGL